MKDISYHMLDIARNSLNAGATQIIIGINEQSGTNHYELMFTDNGQGIEQELLDAVTDPFYTTGSNKRVGLGLPLLKQNAEQAGGFLQLASVKGESTTVRAVFQLHHIDRIPEGNIGLTLRVLIAGNPLVNFIYRHRVDQQEWDMETEAIRNELYPVPIGSPEVLAFIERSVNEAIAGLRKKP